jgi:hypothetical protein
MLDWMVLILVIFLFLVARYGSYILLKLTNELKDLYLNCIDIT